MIVEVVPVVMSALGSPPWNLNNPDFRASEKWYPLLYKDSPKDCEEAC